MDTKERLHALDAVRAFALLSGIVLHAAMSFMPGLAAFGFPADVSQSPALQIVFYVIHVFRMSLFFFIAGYFGHLMFHRKGAAGFARDRAKRIVIPFVVGWAFFGPMAMAVAYMTLGPVTNVAPPKPQGFPLAHLWFLYYLVLLYGIALALRACFVKWVDGDGTLRARVDRIVNTAVRSHVAPALIAAPVALCLYLTPNWMMWGGIATPDIGFAPQLPPLVAYGVAFVFGWLMHRQSDLLAVWKQRWALHMTCAVAFTALSLWIAGRAPNPFDVAPAIKLAYAATYTLAIWNWVFGLVGTALRFFPHETRVGRYLADSSYWVYLAHLPVVFALQLVVLDWPLHWAIKFPVIVASALGLLLLSYQLMVRNTFIGEVLNGKRRKPAAAKGKAGGIGGESSQVIAELRDVHKSYGTHKALAGVDLQIRSGEVLALLGSNGAGKSTAVSLLLGLQSADAGSVDLFGRAPDSPEAMDARRQVGVMLQEVTLPAESRVRELIDLSSGYYAAPLTVMETIALTGTADIADRPYGKLSGGQQRLVQFALAVCGRPKLLFLDEPTTGLDIEAREALWSTVRRLMKQGCAVVLTTHYLEEAEALADRIAVLARGRIVATGSVDEVRSMVSRKRITCVSSLSAEQIRHWPGVTEVSMQDGRLQITAIDAESVTRQLLIADAHVSELEVSRAGLAEAFVQLTQEAA